MAYKHSRDNILTKSITPKIRLIAQLDFNIISTIVVYSQPLAIMIS